ncbi:MAG: acetate kinase [Prevotellaceae bacterium]|jgi:acetate kinase|nr:acetate kinase [Prevotellaceae bacterium]
MKILVLNCGSSSIKYKVIDMENKAVLGQGGMEKVGLSGSFLKHEAADGRKVKLEQDIPEHETGIKFILDVLTNGEYRAINSLNELDAVGHRVVHGGEKFSESVLITGEVIKKIEECIEMAPLHNPANLMGISAISKLLPNIPQVAVFDTAFHQTMPEKAFMYAIPYEMYQKYAIRRYGFHGTSHRYVSKRAIELLNLDPDNSKIITCHIGNGGSVTAVLNGKSVDTSMGFTPIEGLMMGTRCGNIDFGAVSYLMEKEHLDIAGISELLNKKSGVLGISGVSSDMRDVEDAAAKGIARARLALDMYDYRIKKYIGSYIAAMNGADAIVLTGGVGENADTTRAGVCEGLEFLGIKLDPNKNNGLRGKEAVISTDDSRVKIIVIPTDEELTIASDAFNILKK